MENSTKQVTIIGAGLAGSECAWQLAEAGVAVTLYEMRPTRKTDAHHTEYCAELVCSNSFRSDDDTRTAIGLLHAEMRMCNSLIIAKGDTNQVPAGSALAVDRDGFAKAVTEALEAHPNITIKREEITELPGPEAGHVVVATGPLTSGALSDSILKHTGGEYLAFFDAIAPIVLKDSVDMSKAWYQSRYDKVGPGGDGKDYLNCPMDKAQYEAFIAALIAGEKTEFKEWEKNTPYFEGCLPIEVMAERGGDTLRFGPMKPVGLTNPHTLPPLKEGEVIDEKERRKQGIKPYAVVQLRQDNKLGTLYNMVGFQTKLKYGAQADIFKMIPGLEQAEFVRLGGIHRNTFINSPELLDSQMRLKSAPHIRFAGQITGVEGYVESAATGLLVGRMLAAEHIPPSPSGRGDGGEGQIAYDDCPHPNPLPRGEGVILPPPTTALGALISHITGGAEAKTFQPMNVNFGLFPPLEESMHKKDRPGGYSARAKASLAEWLKNCHPAELQSNSSRTSCG